MMIVLYHYRSELFGKIQRPFCITRKWYVDHSGSAVWFCYLEIL